MSDDRRRYRKIFIRLWRNPAFRALPDAEKVVTLYLLSGPQTNRIGLFQVSYGQASEDLECSVTKLAARVSHVCQTFSWVLDAKTNVIWIPSWWDFNAPSENMKNMQGALSDLHDLPATPLITRFAEHLAFVPTSLHPLFRYILNKYQTRTVFEQCSDTDRTQEKETRQDKQDQEQDSALLRGFGPTNLISLWNETAKTAGLRPCLALSGDRLTHARNRLREQPERAYWEAVIARIASSPGCRGQNDRGWIADMDFLLRKSTHVKVLEGKYDAWGQSPSGQAQLSRVTAAALRAYEES